MKRILLLVGLMLFVVGCSRSPQPVAEVAPPAAAKPDAQWLALATPYVVSEGDSLLTIRVYRAGRLASLGHNHVISSDSLQGSIYVGADYADTWFELTLPVAALRVDDAQMRDRYGDEFAAPVPADAIAGTTENMRAADVLDAADWPVVAIQGNVTSCVADRCAAELYIELKGQVTRHRAVVLVERHADRLVVSSEFSLSQKSLGLEPFSVMMGALSVADELRFAVDLVAPEVVAGELLLE